MSFLPLINHVSTTDSREKRIMITNVYTPEVLRPLTSRDLRATVRDTVSALRMDSLSGNEIREALSNVDNILAELDRRDYEPDQAHYVAQGYSITTVWQRRADGLYDTQDGLNKGYSLHRDGRLVPCAFGRTPHNVAACLARSVFDRFEVEIQTSYYTDAGEHVYSSKTKTLGIGALYAEYERKSPKGQRRAIRVTDAWRHGAENEED